MVALRRLACLLVILAVPCSAQIKPEDRLPADTAFYALWRGPASFAPVRGTNPLLRMWADPEFTPERDAFLEQILAETVKDFPPGTVSREDLLALLENPLLIGATRGSSGTRGGFLIYDASGKAELLAKLLKLEPTGSQEKPTITQSTVGQTVVETVSDPKRTYYRAFVGNYFVRSDRKETLEDWIARLTSPQPPTGLLTESADFQKARAQMDRGAALEFFLRIPDLSRIQLPLLRGFDLTAFLRALHLERIRSVSSSLHFASNATRVRMTLLGDTSPGGILDITGESKPAFDTLRAAPGDAASYGVARFDVSALYQTLRNALVASLQPEQRGSVEMIEGSIGKQLGMELAAALKLFGGEFAAISMQPGADPLSDLYVATIQKPEEVLNLLHTLLTASITSEDREGEATYLAIAAPYTDSKTGARRQRFYYVAVTPRLLLAGRHKTALREAVARLTAANDSPAGSLGREPQFARARARFSQSLSGFGYLDLTRVPWSQVSESLAKVQQEAAQQASSGRKAPDFRRLLIPSVLARYLHIAASAWWKNQDGIYYDSYLE